MSWTENAAMFWHDGTTFKKITDHNRTPLSISVERFERKQRMANGTLRRYSVAKKRTWSASWDMLPSRNDAAGGITTADGGWAGKDIENFHNSTDGAFRMRLRAGRDSEKAITDGTIEEVTVMITDFSKEVVKRGVVDFWNLSITLEEV